MVNFTLYKKYILFTIIILTNYQDPDHPQCHLHFQVISETELGFLPFFSSARTYTNPSLQESERLRPEHQEKPELLYAFCAYQKS